MYYFSGFRKVQEKKKKEENLAAKRRRKTKKGLFGSNQGEEGKVVPTEMACPQAHNLKKGKGKSQTAWGKEKRKSSKKTQNQKGHKGGGGEMKKMQEERKENESLNTGGGKATENIGPKSGRRSGGFQTTQTPGSPHRAGKKVSRGGDGRGVVS